MTKPKSRSKKQIAENQLWLHWGSFLAIFVVWSCIVCKNYYHYHPLNLSQIGLLFHLEIGKIAGESLLWLLKYMGITVLLLAVFVGTFFVGRRVFIWLKFSFSSLLEEFMFSVGLGLGILAYTTLLLGLLGILYKSLFYVLLVVFSLLGIKDIYGLWKRNKSKNQRGGSHNLASNYWNYIFGFILLILVLINLCIAFVPDLFYDSLVYHLGCANYYVIKHKILPMPYNYFSYMPLSMSMLYTVCLLLQGTSLAKLLHFATGILTVLTTLALSKRFFRNYSIGLLGGTFFYFAPLVAMHSWTGGNDLGLAFMHTLTVYALLIWFYAADGRPGKWLALSAVFAGFTASIKYSSGFCLFPIPFLIGWKFFLKDKEKFLKAFKKIVVYLAIVILVLSPWLIKAWLGTGNPIHPFFSRWLEKEKTIESSDLTQDYPIFGKLLGGKEATATDKSYEIKLSSFINKAKEILKLPWILSIRESSSYRFVGPIFLLFMPLVLLIKKKNNVIICLLWYFLFSFCFLGIFTGKLKYYIPAIPVIGIITAYTVQKFYKIVPKYIGEGIFFFILILLSTNLYFLTATAKFVYSPFKILTGLESWDDYLSYTRPTYPNPSYKVMKYVNDNLPNTCKVLFIGDAKVFYIKRDFIANTVHNKTPIILWAKASENGDELYYRLKKEELTHILLNTREGLRTCEHWQEKRDLGVFNEFWEKYTREIYHAEGTYLYEILSEEEASKPHSVPINFLAELEKHNYERGCLPSIYREHKNWDGMIEEYESYQRLGANVDARLGWCYLQKGDYQKAKQMYQKALSREPQNQQYYKVLEQLDKMGVR